MMRIDVDFNERDGQGRVVARVPAAQASQLMAGQPVNLYDPPERLWADAVVAGVDPETCIVVFDVDWHSFVDAEVADISDASANWSIGVPPTEGVGHLVNCWVVSSTTGWGASSRLGGMIIVGEERTPINVASSGSVACLNEEAEAR